MWDILSDPTCQFVVGLIVAIVAIIIPIIVYLRQRQRKSLSYQVVSTPLLSIREDIKKDLQISYKGKPVEQVHLVIFKMLNSGNVPIPSKDYESPVTLSFGKQAKILTAEIIKTNPDSLHASLHTSEKIVELVPTLLNQGDFVTIKMLVTKKEKEEVNGRIIGVKEIQEFTRSKVGYWILAIVGTAIVYIPGIIGDVLPYFIRLPLVGVGAAVVVVGLFKVGATEKGREVQIV